MSVKIMSRVWESSKQKGTDLLLLLALADNADDEGYCWPGIEYLRKKIRMTSRSVINALQRIEEDGEVIINHNRRSGNRYIVAVGMSDKEREHAALKLGCENFSSEACFISEVKNIHIRSETAISQESSIPIIESPISNDDEKQNGQSHFVALMTLCKFDSKLMTKDQRGQLAGESKRFKTAGITPEQIARFGKYWYAQDWRGKKGQAPTPAQVRAEWGKFKDSGYFEEATVGW